MALRSLCPIRSHLSRIFCLRTFSFLRLLKLCRAKEDLKQVYSLLVVRGLNGDELLLGEFFRSCFHLGTPYLALSVFRRIEKPRLSFQNLMIRCLCQYGLHDDVLRLYLHCRSLGCPFDDFTFPSVIKACTALGDSRTGKELHCLVLRTGFGKNLVIQTALVDFYAKSGRIRSARYVIDRMPEPDLVSWNALISGYSLNGLDWEAVEAFRRIFVMGLKPNLSTLASMIPVCTRLGWIEVGKSLHGFAVKCGYSMNAFLVPALVSMYAGDMDSCMSRNLFDSVPQKNITVWNAVISAYTQMEMPMEAFVMFLSMLRSDIQPNLITFISIIPSCANLSSLSYGKSIHASAIRHGSANQVPVSTVLLSMYAKLGDVDSASCIFSQMPNRNRLSWNSMISGYVYNGLWEFSLDAFSKMQFEGFNPDEVSIVSITSACSKLEALLLGKSIHAFSLRKGYESNLNVSNALLAFYAGCQKLSSCFKLFYKMPIKTTVSWNTLISICIHNREMETAATVLHQMQKQDPELDPVTLISILPIFSDRKFMGHGMAFHCYSVKCGFSQDVSLINALISMYCNCGDLDAGKLLFEIMPEKSVVSWNSMMTGFRYHSLYKEVMVLFGRMMRDRKRPNHITLLNLLPACYNRLQGKSVHAFAIRTGIIRETPFLTSLIIMYARFDDIRFCRILFQTGEKEDISMWNSIMSVHIQTKNASKAIVYFSNLLQMGLEPDNLTVLSLVSACIQVNSLKLANSVMAYLICKGFDKEVTISNALINLYARYGNISTARKLFDRLRGKDNVSWSVMINGYGLHGDGKAALDLFIAMELSGMKPDGITFLTILSACSHSGLADEGRRVFHSMAEQGISPRPEHYACLVDLLARTGNLMEAYEIVKGLPFKPSTSLLEALLGACSIYGNVELGEKIGRKLFDLEPENSRAYVMLHNIYAGAGRWTEAEKVRSEIEKRRLRKIPGFSLFLGDEPYDKELG
ncbi:Tetratricopeptide-like helical domain containing protein [Parasponia andersonii]|uniref:Tetratricopeptide-like helical domain containing protein n=1 Tax=Parasponia andersonii TaxID=3476 RepID=A0A2P5ATH5_PARAD|nr:Tetratricopeptide-like helical domain containing protein [Parasponia andersonii]